MDYDRGSTDNGRNYNSVGNEVVSETSTGFPEYDSIVPIDKDPVGSTLKENGYATGGEKPA
jgi:arylsulfatase